MKILPNMFKFVCSLVEMHPRFLDIIFGLGRKTSFVNETFIGFYTCFSLDKDGNTFSYGRF